MTALIILSISTFISSIMTVLFLRSNTFYRVSSDQELISKSNFEKTSVAVSFIFFLITSATLINLLLTIFEIIIK